VTVRYRTLLPGAALVMAALTVTACSSGGSAGGAGAAGVQSNSAATAGANTVADDGAAGAVTVARARQVFGNYVSATASALAKDDEQAALAVTGGAAQDMVTDQFVMAHSAGTKLPDYRYGTPTFYRPDLTSAPRWFAVSVRRTASAPTTLAGVPVAAQGEVLMVFDQASATSPWLLVSSAQLTPGQPLPAIGVTSAGYAETVPANAGTTLAQPDVTGPLQAAVVDDGPASAATRAVAAGPLTTGVYAYQSSPAPQYAAPHGDVRQWSLEGTSYGNFALRTANGGALVLYAMDLDTVVEVPSVPADASPLRPGPPISIPTEFVPLLKPGTPSPRYKLITQLVLSFAAIDPPAAAGGTKIQVVAVGGSPNWASAS